MAYVLCEYVEIQIFLVMSSLMARNHGLITEFLSNADDWEAYIIQLESYFVEMTLPPLLRSEQI